MNSVMLLFPLISNIKVPKIEFPQFLDTLPSKPSTKMPTFQYIWKDCSDLVPTWELPIAS